MKTIITCSVPLGIILKHVFMYLQKPPLLVDVYICQGEPSVITTKKITPKEYYKMPAEHITETTLSCSNKLPCGTAFSLHQLKNQMIGLNAQMDST